MTLAPSDTSTIKVDKLVVIRGKRHVLKNLTFATPPRMITGLLGPSGCGKTTLMRSIVGVQRTQSGTVTVLGQPAGSVDLRHRVGYVTQAPSIYFDLSVRDNLRYFASLYGIPAYTINPIITDVGLSEHADQLVGNLSGGQRTRASLACALMIEPEVLILDEPTVGLDPVIRSELWQRFHALAQEGTTLMISSHVMDEANRCHRLLLMRDGVFVADDTPKALQARSGTNDLEQAFLQLIAAHNSAEQTA